MSVIILIGHLKGDTMSTLILTISLAFVIVIAAVAFLGIGKLITGRSKLHLGACGRDPNKKREEQSGCGTSSHCSLCDQDSKDDKNSKRDV